MSVSPGALVTGQELADGSQCPNLHPEHLLLGGEVQ